jgi:putative radical SAM enzyme (TIGR03279 family)
VLQITKIYSNTIAATIGLKSGDKIVSINDQEINDQLDFNYHFADDVIEILIQRDNEKIIYEIEKENNQQLGVELQEMKMKACGNNCIFCFVFQNPKGMRKALYFKDEDYRFSFLHGHYVTLTTVKQKELDRIVDQKLSPLYISVHSTEEETRKILLGIKHNDHLLHKIEYLIKGGIELHTQIVLCQGINDGPIFEKTVNDLKQFYPGVRSIAVVPVGLTKHRDTLYPLRLHTISELRDMIRYTNIMRENLRVELGKAFVYLADEFFIKAQQAIPNSEYYDDFYQIENGVGEFRELVDRFNKNFSAMIKRFERPVKLTWVTGTLAADLLEKTIVVKLRTLEKLKLELIAVKNNFYGESIKVSGLLVGGDIYNQLKQRDLGDVVLLPPRLLNHDGLFLDNWTIPQLTERLGTPCHVYKESLNDFVKTVTKILDH